MKAINKRLVASFVLSIFLHAFVILLFFLFQKKTSYPFPEKKIDLKKKDEHIVLLSLTNYQVSEKQNTPNTEPENPTFTDPSFEQQTEPTSEEKTKEPVILAPEPEQLALRPSVIEPKEVPPPLVQKTVALNKETEIKTPPKKEPLSLEERIAKAKNLLCKNKTSLTKTVTKTDFFKHAHAVAQQVLHRQSKEDLSARISGLGNLKLYSYEEKLRSTLLTAFNSLKHRIDRTVRPEQQHLPSPQPHAAINLIINKDGSIDTLDLITSSGDQRFDALIIDSIKYAAPFPPIPVHLGIDKFQLGAMQLYVRY